MAVLSATDLRKRIIDSQGAESELQDHFQRIKTFPLRKAQELRQANGAFTLFEPGKPPDSTSRGACEARSCAITTRMPSPATLVAERPRGLSRSGCTGRTSEAAFGGTCALAALRFRQGRKTYRCRITASAVLEQRGNQPDGPLPSIGARKALHPGRHEYVLQVDGGLLDIQRDARNHRSHLGKGGFPPLGLPSSCPH
jgi:hypothetical protein